jgi:hypothetical protein
MNVTKFRNFTLIPLAFLFLQKPLLAQSMHSLVTVTGDLKPEFSIEVSQGDLSKIKDELTSLNQLEKISMDINELMDPKDEKAIKAAAQSISNTYINVGKHLLNMKAMIYRLSALNSLNDSEHFREGLFQSYQKKFQNSFSVIINSFSQPNQELMKAMLACKSELCVMKISNAHIELVNFGKTLNKNLTIQHLHKLKFSFDFESSLIKASLSETYNQLIEENRKSNIFAVSLAVTLTPFISAAKGAGKLGEDLFNVLKSPNLTEFKLSGKKIKIKYRKVVNSINDIASQKIDSIVNGISFHEAQKKERNSRIVSLLACAPSKHIKNLFEPKQQQQVCYDCNPSNIGFAGIYGTKAYECLDLLNKSEYRVSVFNVGLGIFYGTSFAFGIIASPIPLNSNDISGKWLGVNAQAGVLLSAGVSTLVGKKASVLTLFEAGPGIGGYAGIEHVTVEAI